MCEGRCLLASLIAYRWIIVALSVLILTGCSTVNLFASANEPLSPKTRPTRATKAISYADLSNGVFIGLALSGGGSRAANLASAVMLELDEIGILPHVTAISSVSGGSLAAAYYGLFGHKAGCNALAHSHDHCWGRRYVKEMMLQDFEHDWLLRALLPQNFSRYMFTNFDRSDIMKAVFDSRVFAYRTFGDMLRTQGPDPLRPVQHQGEKPREPNPGRMSNLASQSTTAFNPRGGG
jgi:hypothetical protein